MSDRFISRWSRLKRQGEAAPSAAPPESAVPAAEAAPPAAGVEAALPPIDSLDLAADFSAFMQKEVSESLRRAALRKLFSDPHFHFEQMDKLDIYIDDYSVADPIPADMLQRLRQFGTLLKEDEEAASAPDAADAAPSAVDSAQPVAEAPREPAAESPSPEMGQERGKTL